MQSKHPPPRYPHTVLSRRLGSIGSFQPEAVGLVVALAFEAVRISDKVIISVFLGAFSGSFFYLLLFVMQIFKIIS
jgi:hypothetical protein